MKWPIVKNVGEQKKEGQIFLRTRGITQTYQGDGDYIVSFLRAEIERNAGWRAKFPVQIAVYYTRN